MLHIVKNNKKRSYDAAQLAGQNAKKVMEDLLHNCNTDKSEIIENLKLKEITVNTCETIFNMVRGEAVNYLTELAEIKAYKTIEIESKRNLTKNDDKLLLTGSAFVESSNDSRKGYEALIDEYLKIGLDKLHTILQPITFDGTTKKN